MFFLKKTWQKKYCHTRNRNTIEQNKGIRIILHIPDNCLTIANCRWISIVQKNTFVSFVDIWILWILFNDGNLQIFVISYQRFIVPLVYVDILRIMMINLCSFLLQKLFQTLIRMYNEWLFKTLGNPSSI